MKYKRNIITAAIMGGLVLFGMCNNEKSEMADGGSLGEGQAGVKERDKKGCIKIDHSKEDFKKVDIRGYEDVKGTMDREEEAINKKLKVKAEERPELKGKKVPVKFKINPKGVVVNPGIHGRPDSTDADLMKFFGEIVKKFKFKEIPDSLGSINVIMPYTFPGGEK